MMHMLKLHTEEGLVNYVRVDMIVVIEHAEESNDGSTIILSNGLVIDVEEDAQDIVHMMQLCYN
jgi:uncharacterized protein YlzI (FlbEa/FlbD family)